MADLIDATTQAPLEPVADHKIPATVANWWQRLALGGVMMVALFMDFYQLGLNGFGNSFYAAGVRSMLDSWHNFFFVSYDPGGFVTLDKPPLGFWLQTLSSKLFGFTPFSVYLPQALAGVLSVLVLYWLVKRHFGVVAGLVASLALALSPISVVTNRNNTIDSVLALVLLLGAWAVIKAAETGKLRWLLLCAAIVGVGFNVKMLEAYLVLPAFGLLYLLAAPRTIWKRVGHLALAALVLLVVSLSWAVVVDMTPAAQRPYVGSSQDNSEISLAFGYNGVQRLLGGFGRSSRTGNGALRLRNGQGGNATSRNNNNGFSGQNGNNNSGFTGQNGGGNGNGRGSGTAAAAFSGGMFNTGNPGPLRLFGDALGGQIAWLLPFAILGMLALACQRKLRFQGDRQQQSLILWGVWLLTMGVFFSVAGFFHQYYLTEMAPAVCALFGIGAVVMWRDYRMSGWRGWLLPLALAVTIVEQVYLLSAYPNWGQWLIPLVAGVGGLAVVALIIARLLPRMRLYPESARYVLPVLSIGLLALFVAPTVWAALPVINNVESQMPAAGPSQGFGARMGSGGGTNANGADTALIHYLESNQGSAKYLVATQSSNQADSLILATNRPVMAMGGFSGSDPILTQSQLVSLVKSGTVRYFLLSSGQGGQIPAQLVNKIPKQYRELLAGAGFGGFNQQTSLTNWVTKSCKAVPSSAWQSAASTTTNGAAFGPGGRSQLYDCASVR